MFHYPYAANGDPNLELLSASQSVSQPMNPSSPPNHPPSSSDDYFLMHHRSNSTYSLPHHPGIPDPAATQLPFDFHHRAEPARRAYSTGDLQVSAENCTQEGAGRVRRYSTEERKERIERYRSKRNHRNFHKKITYACRKTLADSRPRVRGRFARNNGEAEAEVEAESSEASYECYSSHNNCESAANGGDWLKQMQAALAAAADVEEFCYDEDVWASFDSVFSMNRLS